MLTELTRTFRPTPHDQLVAKLYNFQRRSLWRYLLAALLLSLAQPGLVGHFALTWLGLSAALSALGLVAVVLSSYRPGASPAFAAEVTFQAGRIEVCSLDGTPAQNYDWRWVRRADESATYFFLTVRDFPRLVLLLDKRKLSADEIAAFRTWLTAGKVAGRRR